MISLPQHSTHHMQLGWPHRCQRHSHRCRGIFDAFLSPVWPRSDQQPAGCEPHLMQWLQQRSLEVDKLKVVPQQVEGQGRGLVASKPIRAGEQILALPENLIIFPQAAAAESVLAPLLPESPAQLPDWTLLVLFLAEQRYYLNRGQPPSSTQWAPYLQALPTETDTILDWPSDDVAKLLLGTGLRMKAEVILAAAASLLQSVHVLTSKAKQLQMCPADMFSRADITWAVSTCLSRTVRLDDRGGDVVLCPFADLINHSCDSSAFLLWNERQKAVVLCADRSYKIGDEVTISYGFKSSGELLLSYGFCPIPGSNPYDAAYLTFGLELTDPFQQQKKQALAARGIPDTEQFEVLIDALPVGLVPYAAFCTARPDKATSAAVEHLAVQLFDNGALPDIDGVNSEVIALQAVLGQCKAALRAYDKQTAAVDKQLAQAVQSTGGGFAQRAAVLAAIRIREQQILSRTEFVVAQRLRELKRSARSM